MYLHTFLKQKKVFFLRYYLKILFILSKLRALHKFCNTKALENFTCHLYRALLHGKILLVDFGLRGK